VVDVAFGEHGDAPDILDGPDLLGFADINPARLPVVGLEKHVAEKVHAYVSVYSGGRPSSRVKDLVDLAMVESLFSMQAGRLADAIKSTFTERDGSPPEALPPPPSQWRLPYRKLATENGLEQEVGRAYERVRNFIDPVLSATVERGAMWNPADHVWRKLP
jgi:hypothetical protein